MNADISETIEEENWDLRFRFRNPVRSASLSRE